MTLIRRVRGFMRLASGLDTFLGQPISAGAAEAIIRDRMSRREEIFLENLARMVFRYGRSPYLHLFRAAGCELGDVRNLVRAEGLEGALQRLVAAGVYVDHEEFKGRRPAVRGSRTFRFQRAEFDNPTIKADFETSSGGTSGTPTRIGVDLDDLADSAPHWGVWFLAHGWMGRPLVFWSAAHAGMASRQLRCARFGSRFLRWYIYARPGTAYGRMASACVHRVVRWKAGFPKPEFVPLEDAWRVGEDLAAMLRRGEKPLVNTAPGAAVRLAVTMRERGVPLEGVAFLLGGEPLTETARRTIEASGAEAVPSYGFSEGGPVGVQCPERWSDDVHIFSDAFAVVHPEPSAAGLPRPLLLTSLRKTCPKVMLNAGIGDSAVIETGTCGCLLTKLGYSRHLHTIRSTAKLTGDGVTFAVADLQRVLAEILPRQFGGTPADYQIVEEQDGQGLARYTLLVSPTVGAVEETAIVSTFLDRLGRLKDSYPAMVDVWRAAGAIRVARGRPAISERGKILPLGSRSSVCA